ncbi:MAG: phosphoglycerate dehydrogenase [Treponema sp.]|jgi:D-3-phosphoglycerate dehydrogenase|nr:phosphoglycerate dehydrogenase [Treponema sp.]
MKILITPASFKPDMAGPALDRLRSFADTLVFNPQKRPLSEDELIPLLDGCDGCIAGLDPFSRKVIENAQTLKVISRYGTGVDNVDLAAAQEKNIIVCNTPGVNAQAVADLTFGCMLSLVRRLPLLDRTTRAGQWDRSIGAELYQKTIGILGLGYVGKAVARRAAGFSMRILACSPDIDSGYAKANGIIPVDFDELVRESDFLSLHLPLNEETRYIISADVMRKMKKGALLINTARGGLLDEAVACDLLKSGHLGGLALDVYETEPPHNSPLFALDNVIVTPHTAARTAEATAAMAALSVQNLIDVLSGTNCACTVSAGTAAYSG